MERSYELMLPKECPPDLYDRIKSYVGKELEESWCEKRFSYTDPISKPPQLLLIFIVWKNIIKIPSYEDLKFPNQPRQYKFLLQYIKF